jgi:hypothetical protein
LFSSEHRPGPWDHGGFLAFDGFQEILRGLEEIGGFVDCRSRAFVLDVAVLVMNVVVVDGEQFSELLAHFLNAFVE